MNPKLFLRASAVLLSTLFLVGMVPAPAFAAAPASIYVNGQDILAAPNYTVDCNGGTAVYDQSSNTLTLSDAEITTAYSSSGIYADGDLTILLEGDNTIDGLYYGIQAINGSISIAGTGSLSMEGILSFGIVAANDLTVGADIGRLYINAATQALRSEQGGTVTIGSEPFTGIDKKITIEHGQVLCPLYELTVNGTDILTAPGNTVACGSGEAVYDFSTNTLTLNNVQINYQHSSGDSNTQGAITFDGDLNIHLAGDNSIISSCAGIYSGYRGTLTITGDKLTVDSVFSGIYKITDGGNIKVDGANLTIDVEKTGAFVASGIHAGGILSILNGAYIDAARIMEQPLMGNGGVVIADSTVYAYTTSAEGYGAITSDRDISISRSTVDAKTNSVYGDVAISAGNATPTIGHITISDNSKVTIQSATGNAAYTPTGNITVTDSEVTAATSGNYPALVANDITISDSTVSAATTGQAYGIRTFHDLQIHGASEVTAVGGSGSIGSDGTFTLTPPDGNLIDVWMGGSEETASQYDGSPLSEATAITAQGLYFHSEPHVHVFDQQTISDAYQASAASCTAPAAYYYSCICGAAGTETFTSGTAAGHSYADGKCTVCGEPDSSFRPVIIAGANGVWQNNETDGLSFTSNAAFADFLKVQVDGTDLDASNYDVREGSTIVTLKVSYLATLPVGTHTLAIVSSTGTAETEFTIQAAHPADDSASSGAGTSHSGAGSQAASPADGTAAPATGDSSDLSLRMAVMAAAAAVLAGTALYSRSKKYRR